MKHVKTGVTAFFATAVGLVGMVGIAGATADTVPTLWPKEARQAAEQVITAPALRGYLTFIASDEMEGRDTPSRGLDTAAQFIAFNLSHWGLKPMGDNGTYFQKIVLRRTNFDPAKTTTVIAGKPLVDNRDFYPQGTTGGIVSGDLVYASHGWVIPSKNVDAYKGIDVKGKIVVLDHARVPDVMAGPPGPGRRQRGGTAAAPADAVDPSTYAAQHGALAVIRLSSARTDDDWKRQLSIASRFLTGRFEVERFQDAGATTAAVPTITISPQAAAGLFAGEKVSLDDAEAQGDSGAVGKGFAFTPGKTAALNLAAVTEHRNTQNVVAAVEGSDPALRDQYVAFGAHYDHVGMGTPDASGDTIFNGADDDGSGTTALLSIAETLGRSPARPKRSILFVWHCGEEKGLWGSSYFTQFPTVPLKQIVAQLNIDMIGRSKPADDTDTRDANLSGPNEVYVIGSKMMSTTLGEISENVNHDYLNLSLNYRYDDVNDPNRFFYRSDHFNYARRGVPIIFYFDGVHRDYHQRGDEVQKIDFAKMEKITRTVLLTGVEIADMKEAPVVDKKLPFPVE